MTVKELDSVCNIIKLSLEDVEERLIKLEKIAHKPVFKQDTADEFDARLQVIEAFYNNIKLITTNKKELQ